VVEWICLGLCIYVSKPTSWYSSLQGTWCIQHLRGLHCHLQTLSSSVK